MWLEMADIKACLLFDLIFRKSDWQRRWEFRKASVVRCEDETVDWVESDTTWLMGFAGRLLAKDSASIWVGGMAVISAYHRGPWTAVTTPQLGDLGP
jgi:hypothetical protein